MKERFTFSPPRRLGIVLHLALILALSAAGAYGLWQASRAGAGLAFLLYLLPGIIAVVIVPLLFYRLLSLRRASYTLQRDGILLRWGLRSEDIPIDVIQWVGAEKAYPQRLPKPYLSLPGAVLGVHQAADGRPVEYLSARSRNPILIVTIKRIFAISPRDPAEFLRVFQHLSEFGSLTPVFAQSVFPDILFARVWADRFARWILLAGFSLSLALLIWVGLAVPEYPRISLHLSLSGALLEPLVPGVRLLLLPVMNSLFFIINLLLGLFFYRHKETQPLSYLMWFSNMVVALFFLGAVFFILRAAATDLPGVIPF